MREGAGLAAPAASLCGGTCSDHLGPARLLGLAAEEARWTGTTPISWSRRDPLEPSSAPALVMIDGTRFRR